MALSTEAHATESAPDQSGSEQARGRWIAAGGILGALAASSCCILPLVLFSLGISGAWIANLTALAPFKPYFAAGTLALLGYGYYLVYVKPKQACADGSCARPLPNRLVKSSLWIATMLVVVALAFDFVAPLLLN
ncbi:mercuric transporter MerT family protein [Hyphomicrobium sp. DMF-1]|jgi:mercuric ion transport protein|uniref:mercuric transporter MerT family protein n=1 Tax=Hyphomicrobium sp. DMF-1 TaxID=3019544 RepID=UPI0022EBB9CB|nr:mercuric transporter MerT family protein [Hyphomicrobium sp. DMF-1]WBT37773.1 mercuric transporter MerT family protein [Hyphomicrobium sp. DMF-1]